MSFVKVGQDYITASNNRVSIVDNNSTVAHNTFRDSEGYSYRPNGQRSAHGAEGPHDLVRVAPVLLDEGSINPGDIVASVHGHEPVTGICKDWMTMSGSPGYVLFEISQKTFETMVQNVRSPERRGDLIQARYAYAISTTIGDDDKISAVLVVYNYDGTYYCSMYWAR